MITIGIDASRANVSQRTGTEWYIFNLLQQLKTIIPEHYRVIIYTKEPLLKDLLPLPSNWRNQVLKWPPKLMWTQLRLSFTMLKWWQRPDLLFIPAHTIPVIHPTKTVYVAHDLGFERSAELYANTPIGGPLVDFLVRALTLNRYNTHELDYHRWSMRFAAHHASTIIAISNFTKHELQHFYSVRDNKIIVVHNGFTAKDYYSQTITKHDSATKPYLLFIGRIERKKNVANLVRAFAILKLRYHLPHQLKLVGFPGYGYEEIEQAIQESGCEKDILQLGYIPQTEMTTLMTQATAFIFPTAYEGFGIPILEAMAARTLVICSDLEPLHEVGGEACQFFPIDNPERIADVIAQTVNLPDVQKEQLRDIGIKQVQQFSWLKCAQQTWEVLLATLNKT